MLRVGGSQECPNCGAYKELVEHAFFEGTSYDTMTVECERFSCLFIACSYTACIATPKKNVH